MITLPDLEIAISIMVSPLIFFLSEKFLLKRGRTHGPGQWWVAVGERWEGRGGRGDKGDKWWWKNIIKMELLKTPASGFLLPAFSHLFRTVDSCAEILFTSPPLIKQWFVLKNGWASLEVSWWFCAGIKKLENEIFGVWVTAVLGDSRPRWKHIQWPPVPSFIRQTLWIPALGRALC